MDDKPSRPAKTDCVQPFDLRHAARSISQGGLDFLNRESRGGVEKITNDRALAARHSPRVERDWHLQEWLEHFGKRQASLVNELGWDKARASFVFNGKQPYRRETVNEVARWLDIEPYELLMPPSEALALRQLRTAAQSIAASQPFAHAADRSRVYTPPPAPKKPAKKVRPAP